MIGRVLIMDQEEALHMSSGYANSNGPLINGRNAPQIALSIPL